VMDSVGAVARKRQCTGDQREPARSRGAPSGGGGATDGCKEPGAAGAAPDLQAAGAGAARKRARAAGGGSDAEAPKTRAPAHRAPLEPRYVEVRAAGRGPAC